MKADSKLLEKAIIFATEKHQGVVRKGNGLPYITHPLAVMTIVNSVKKSKNQFILAIASILHDTFEDTETTLEEIAKTFGYNVASIVQELSSDKEQVEKMGKDKYLLSKMLGMSSYSLCIKLADRYHNIQDMDSMKPEFKEKYINETLYILEGLSGRKLSKTHLKLIKMIKKHLK